MSQHQGNPYWNANGQPMQQGYQEGHAVPPQYGPPSTVVQPQAGGPGPANATEQQYAPPPGPPPQAHLKGDDHGQNFVGGFNPRN
ncbi:hypothetical protein CVT24_012842 [Panaeolus cyanescens]|uniref:Uncharacterized protein n=1 Tax=Panaeolus cyanescens TaxID=181874 RepID=A0A409W6I1_9AGAR|nr:hypothetical protein CVT24_012842 [Panaeolus cyanescens]